MEPVLFVQDLEGIPESLSSLATRLRGTEPWAAVEASGVRRVLLLGMGSSLYAAGTVARQMRAAGLAAVAEHATTEQTWPARPDTLVVAVSATGGSAETLHAATRLARAGSGPVVALTARPDSELARVADTVVDLGCAPEAGGVACTSYRHTVVLLQALAARLAGTTYDPEPVQRAAGATAHLLRSRDGWLPGVRAALDSPDGVAVLAPAERLASAQQSALMIRECPRRPAAASETGDWAHVDVYLARTLDYRALLLPGSRWDAQAMEWLNLRGSRVVPVGAEVDGAGPAVRYPGDDDPAVRLLTETTVAELLAASWWGAPSSPG